MTTDPNTRDSHVDGEGEALRSLQRGIVSPGATPATPAVPGFQGTLEEQIAQTMKASLSEQDPAKRSALNGQLKALNRTPSVARPWRPRTRPFNLAHQEGAGPAPRGRTQPALTAEAKANMADVVPPRPALVVDAELVAETPAQDAVAPPAGRRVVSPVAPGQTPQSRHESQAPRLETGSNPVGRRERQQRSVIE